MQAYVAHLMDQRVRLRVPACRGDTGVFRRLAEVLNQHSEVQHVQVTPRTGSVLVFHTTTVDALLEHVRQGGIELTLEAPPQTDEGPETASTPAQPDTTPMHAIDRELRRLEDRLRQRTRGSWGLGELSFYALLGASGLQIARGQYFPAATALLEKALGTLQATVKEKQGAQNT